MSGSAPGGPRRLAGEADREQLVALLREHYALGQLDDDELDRRVGAVLSARYMDEAASAVADLPRLAAPGSAAGPPSRRRRGHAQAAEPVAGWIPTGERFRDPTTRAVMRVWIDPADQSRHYVPEPDA
ncbi:MAG TPA: DUF1707 domain-containing protein [Streptosporangiaceae bacterium]|nr:DUF1707 domain-containing protein [Streptosporangiaceae bacterium]